MDIFRYLFQSRESRPPEAAPPKAQTSIDAQADLVVRDGNPLESVENAKKVANVVKNGFVTTPTVIFAPGATITSSGTRSLSREQIRLAKANRKRMTMPTEQRPWRA